jgi:hypothetical protein
MTDAQEGTKLAHNFYGQEIGKLQILGQDIVIVWQ